MNQQALDTLITIGILLIGGLAIWAKASQQTIIELLRDIKEYMQETKEDGEERLGYYG